MQKETATLQKRRGKARMPERTWRDRLAAAITKDGRSMRAISLAAGQNESYVWEMFNKGKEPTITPLVTICSILGVSTHYILTGVEQSALNERFLKAFAEVPEAEQLALLALLEARKKK